MTTDAERLATIRHGVHHMLVQYHLHNYSEWVLLLRLIDERDAEIATLRQERDAARAEVERLRELFEATRAWDAVATPPSAERDQA